MSRLHYPLLSIMTICDSFYFYTLTLYSDQPASHGVSYQAYNTRREGSEHWYQIVIFTLLLDNKSY